MLADDLLRPQIHDIRELGRFARGRSRGAGTGILAAFLAAARHLGARPFHDVLTGLDHATRRDAVLAH